MAVADNGRDDKVKKDWCSCWPDRFWKVHYGNCCEVHDEEYERGGTAEDRKRSDQHLCDCVYSRFDHVGKRKTGWLWSNMMYVGVRLFASRWFCRYIYPRTHQRFNWKDQEKDNASS